MEFYSADIEMLMSRWNNLYIEPEAVAERPPLSHGRSRTIRARPSLANGLRLRSAEIDSSTRN
jgi:hypothetical protein